MREILRKLRWIEALRRLAVGAAMLTGWPGAGHAAADVTRAWQQSVQTYILPAIKLVGADGVGRPLAKALDDGRPTVMTFMFSSCATVCPIMNQTMVQFEYLLGSQRAGVNTVSISIDPTQDTVEKLAEFAKRSGASGSFYTSDPGVSEAVQRAFNVWRGGDKMAHRPVFLLRANGASPWVRVDGLLTPKELLGVYRSLAPMRNSKPGH